MTVEPTDFARMVAGNEAVVKAEVPEVRGAWVGEGTDRRIVTTVRLRVRETAKGAPKAGEEMALEFLGGRAPDGRRMIVYGMPEFRVGETEILFVQTADQPICPLVGVHHGLIQLRRDPGSGREEVFRHDGVAATATADLGHASDNQKPPLPVPGKSAMTADELLAAVMIAGFIIQGFQPKKVTVRALGPSLAAAGVPGALANPRLELRNSAGQLMVENDDWRGGPQAAEIQSLGRAPGDDREAVIIATLPAGSYTVIVRGVGDTTGVALVEVYDLDPP